jgi:rhodanese-related sulfurtransferase
MKYVLALASVLVLLPALAEDAPKAAEPAQKSAFELPPPQPYVKLTPASFDKLHQVNTNAIVLDVRTPEEFAKGHIAGATLLDFKSPGFAAGLEKLDKKKTYLVHCAVGGRSAKACLQMHDLGFVRVFNLEGGLQAWQAAGKPVVK